MSGQQGLHLVWKRLSLRLLPFADAATGDLPLGRLIRLALFQVSVGMATVLLIGTLNRVMIVEFRVPAWVVAVMFALPLLIAPLRAVVGHRSDTYRSALGWRRVPFIWYGTMLQFGGLAIMPFALLILSGDAENGPQWIGHVATGLAFFLTAAGLQTTQTAGLALATDLAAPDSRPRVVSLMYVMLLVGMVASGLVFSLLLDNFTPMRLVQVIQGAAVVTVILNGMALWKQEARDPSRTRGAPAPPFRAMWARFTAERRARRYLWALALGTAAFNMQDIILEPYGGEILGLPVAATTLLTAELAAGSLAALAVAARFLRRGVDPVRLAAAGGVVGLFAFSAVIFASPAHSGALFQAGAVAIGFGGALFAVSMLIMAMDFERLAGAGIALGAWGAVQATSAGLAIAGGGVLRDVVHHAAMAGHFGAVLADSAVGYSAVYHLELFLLFLTLIALGPLARRRHEEQQRPVAFGLSEMPG